MSVRDEDGTLEARAVRLLCISDLHSHAFEQFATTLPNGRNSRLQTILDVLAWTRSLCVERGIDTLVFCGDLFHSRTKIAVDVFSSTWLAWEKIAEVVEHVYILVGNHDQANKVGTIHSLEPFRAFATVVDQPIIDRIGDVTFAMHPFTTNIDEWRQFVDMLPKGLDFFFFHQGISQAVTGAFDISVKAEVDFTDFPIHKTRWCLGGHYHRRQMLGEDRRIGYIGSPLQHNFSERNEEKGVLIFDDVTKRPEFVRTTAPRFVLYESGATFFEAFAADASDPRAPWNRGDFIRVSRCTTEQADLIKKEFPRIQVEILKEKFFEENRVDADVVNSDRTLLEEYIKLQSVNGLDKGRLLSFGLEALMEDA